MIVRTERVVILYLYLLLSFVLSHFSPSSHILNFFSTLSLSLSNPPFQNEIIKELAPGLVISEDGLPIMPNMGMGQFAPGTGDGLGEGVGGFGGSQGMPAGCSIC